MQLLVNREGTCQRVISRNGGAPNKRLYFRLN